ncbi:hypothetical protein M3Y99_01045600 [Aphelenchoides fujianensis]|nr:hypothetical protein M3Y99_01045600 [Aphelenchoides fujianensis]
MSFSRNLMDAFKERCRAAADAQQKAAQLWSLVDAEELVRELEEQQAAVRRERDEWTAERQRLRAERRDEQAAVQEERDQLAAERERLLVDAERTEVELNARISKRGADCRALLEQVRELKAENKRQAEANAKANQANAVLQDRVAQLESAFSEQKTVETDLLHDLDDLQAAYKDRSCHYELQLQQLQVKHTEEMEGVKRAVQSALRTAADQVDALLVVQRKYEELQQRMHLVKGMCATTGSDAALPPPTTNVARRLLRDINGSSRQSSPTAENESKRPRQRYSSTSTSRPHTHR